MPGHENLPRDELSPLAWARVLGAIEKKLLTAKIAKKIREDREEKGAAIRSAQTHSSAANLFPSAQLLSRLPYYNGGLAIIFGGRS
jgi:hypothetical protein